MTLIEPLARRVDFLFEVVEILDIKVDVVRGRSESIKGQFDYVTARAVAPLPRLVEMSWHLVAPGGRLLAIKGESAGEELAATKLDMAEESLLHEINLDDLPVSRVIELDKAG